MSTVNDYAENSHDPLCVKYISGDDLPCICDLLAEHAQIIRADERERMAGLARRVQGGGIRDYEAEVRERLREAWREEGHAVLFNLTGDDLTPAQRVGKWLGGESEWK